MGATHRRKARGLGGFAEPSSASPTLQKIVLNTLPHFFGSRLAAASHVRLENVRRVIRPRTVQPVRRASGGR